MVHFTRTTRHSGVLTKPSLPCLSIYHAINLTSGCLFQCRYCYARGYSNYPGNGNVAFYENSFAKLRDELPRKKRRPRMVYFSSYSEPFMPIQAVLDEQFLVMEFLLKNKISLLISTKAKIPDRFVELFSGYPNMVHVQVGLTTIDEEVRRLIEPFAATTAKRLENVSKLVAEDIRAEIRMDPLIPMLTDTERSMRMLLEEAAKRGIHHAVASFLHLRKSNARAMEIKFKDWVFPEVRQRLYRTIEKLGQDGCAILLPDKEYRMERLRTIRKIGQEFGIAIKSCACKNPDLSETNCHPRPKMGESRQLDLI